MTVPLEFIDRIRAVAEEQYPTPFRRRSYQFPAIYPAATLVKNTILDPIGVFLFGIECQQLGTADVEDLEQMTAQFMTRIVSWRNDHPLYLLTPGLVDLLVNTDRLDEPNVDEDSRPPFQGGHFVLPKHLLGTPNGAYGTVLSYGVIHPDDYIGTPINPPLRMKDRRFYVTMEMSSGEAYFARLHIDNDGTVQNPEDSPYVDHVSDMVKEQGAAGDTLARYTYPDGPGILAAAVNLGLCLFTYLNMDKEADTISPAACTGIAKAKKGKPERQFWNPAVLGVGLTPTGMATQGSHASPHAHLRRGHMKRVRHGKGLEQVKRVWIKPTLVKPKPEFDQPNL